MVTLFSKSMPSTCSRKPCTKCWRACSPSPITSRPRSSWVLTQSRVASDLASIRAAPSAFHCGQSFWVSASQAGLGRLPAIAVGKAVGNMVRVSGFYGGCPRRSLPALGFKGGAWHPRRAIKGCPRNRACRFLRHCGEGWQKRLSHGNTHWAWRGPAKTACLCNAFPCRRAW